MASEPSEVLGCFLKKYYHHDAVTLFRYDTETRKKLSFPTWLF